LDVNGAAYRGGTAYLNDGANISILAAIVGRCQHQPKNDAGSSSSDFQLWRGRPEGAVVVNTIENPVQSNITVRVISMSETTC